MKKTLNFRHSGDMGDIVAGLYAVKQICEKEDANAVLWLDTSGGKDNPIIMKQSGGLGNKFNDSGYRFLKPLLEEQRYIKKVEKYDANSPIDCDLNRFREAFMDKDKLMETGTNLLYAHQLMFGLPMGVNEPWLEWMDVPVKRKVLMSRSTRYHSSDQIYLQQRNAKSVNFMGTDLEEKCFRDCTRMELPRISITNALDAAKTICASEKFIVNGTLFYWIAVGMGHPDIVHELGVDIPTTHFFKENMPNIKYVQGARFLK